MNGEFLVSLPLRGQAVAVADVGILIPNGYTNVVHFEEIELTPKPDVVGKSSIAIYMYIIILL